MINNDRILFQLAGSESCQTSPFVRGLSHAFWPPDSRNGCCEHSSNRNIASDSSPNCSRWPASGGVYGRTGVLKAR